MVAMSACRNETQCTTGQYWSTVLRACVGVGEYMDAHGGSFPDGYVAPEAATSDASMDSALSCDGGEIACGARCTSTESDPLNCGACGVACTSSANATATCVAGRCDLRCDTGAHRCGAACVRDSDPASCGTRCSPCPEPLGASATCAMGACGYACLAGYDDTGAACEMRAPRPLFPWGTSTVTQLRPTLEWELPMGVEGAQIELCRDRACTMVIERVNAVGSSAQPAADLPRSTVIFWRARGRIGASNGTRTSATWQFRTPAASATTADTAHGLDLDLNGDGFSDVAIGAPGADGGQGRVDVYYGSATGLGAMPGAVLRGTSAGEGFGASIASVGDVNGDGFADLAVQRRTPRNTVIIRGSLTGAGTRITTATSALTVEGAGDVNGDGYADLLTATFDARIGGVDEAGSTSLWLGTTTGLAPTPELSLDGMQVGGQLGASVAGAFDFNGDRLADWLVGEPGSIASGLMRAGSVRLFEGSEARAGTTPSRLFEGSEQDARLGQGVSGGGSIDGDGFGSIVISSPRSSTGGVTRCGQVFVYDADAGRLPASPSTTIAGTEPSQQLGHTVRNIGDVDADGRFDVVIGAPLANVGTFGLAGSAYIHLATASGLSPTPSRVLRGGNSAAQFGTVIANAGDSSSDGFADVLISAPGATDDPSTFWGSVTLWSGSASGISATPTRTLVGSAMSDIHGAAIACRRSARATARLCRAGLHTTPSQ